MLTAVQLDTSSRRTDHDGIVLPLWIIEDGDQDISAAIRGHGALMLAREETPSHCSRGDRVAEIVDSFAGVRVLKEKRC